MRRSFYHYMLTLRGPVQGDPVTQLANELAKDIQFPKQSQDYQEIADYLELNTSYIPNMDIFDLAWEKYFENNRT